MLKLPKLIALVAPYLEEKRLRLLNVYIREAHPSGGWEIGANTSGAVAAAALGTRTSACPKQTRTLEQRLAVANRFQRLIADSPAGTPPRMLVDDPSTNALDIAYEALPERLVLLSADGLVLFCTGQGPYQYSLDGLDKFLQSEFPPSRS